MAAYFRHRGSNDLHRVNLYKFEGVLIMAKVTAPFLSLSARGSVANTLTAQNWKGLNTMRQKPQPSNPRTTAQQSQRTKIAAAIQAWRTGEIDLTIKEAWDRLASVSGKPITGFNLYVRYAVQELRIAAVPIYGKETGTTVPVGTFTKDFVVSTFSPFTYPVLSGRTFMCRGGSSPSQLTSVCECTVGESDGLINPDGIIMNLAEGETFYAQFSEVLNGVSVPISGVLAYTVISEP